MNPFVCILIALCTAVIGAVVGYKYRQDVAEKKIGRTEEYAKKLLEYFYLCTNICRK